MADSDSSGKSTSLTIPGGDPISLTVRPTVRAAFDRARVRSKSRNRSEWAESIILAATEGLYTGSAHERLRAASEALDLPQRTLVRLWLMSASDEDVARSMTQARTHQLAREK